jgi:hypothetical protein
MGTLYTYKHQEKHRKIYNFIGFLALEHIILKSKVQKVVNYYHKVEKLEKVEKVSKAILN